MQFSFDMIIWGALALLCTQRIVFMVRQWAIRRQILAIPNERSSHTLPTPSGGGLAISLVTVVGWLLYTLFHHTITLAQLTLLSGGLLIALISWLDDLYTMPILVRLGTHSLAALLVLGGIGWYQVIQLPFLPVFSLGWFGPVLTLLWIVSLTNAYNFMDGIDGIAGGQAVVAGIGWLILGWFSQQPLVMSLGLFVAASSLGFLQYNWSPAQIFMGDVGSAFLGYTFAALTIMAGQSASSLVLAGWLLLWPFVFDTTFTLFRRWRNGENIFIAHRSHLYQRLVIAGYSHRTVTMLYLALATIGGLLSLAWYAGSSTVSLILVLGLSALAFGLWLLVTRAERPYPPAFSTTYSRREAVRPLHRPDGGITPAEPSLQH